MLAAAGCVLVDAATLEPFAAARRVREMDPDVQVVVVARTEQDRRSLQRAMLFAPGIGEVWLASPGEVAGAVAERAAGVTRQRRRFRRTRERLDLDQMVASPQRTERALISDEYLANLLQVLPDPVFSVDAVGRILSANPAATGLLAPTGPDLVGRALHDALGANDPTAVATLLAAAASRPASMELAFRRGDGSAGHGELRATPVNASDVAFHAVVLHDLTSWHRAQQLLEDQTVELEHQASMLQDQTAELEQANEALLQQRVELQSALDAKSRFYAAMSHELRTPINAIIGYTDLALEGIYGALGDPLRTALTRSQRAASHLHELVNDVLDMAKIEAGRIELVRETVDVAELAEDILHSVRPSAEESDTPIVLDCRYEQPVTLHTDPRRVRQVLLNLLANAIKFGVGRPVTLRCSASAGQVSLSVEDRGPGIAEADQARVFEEFVQLEPNAHRGTGLGLPISRRLAQLLGGSLTVASAEGSGSTFTLRLPLG